MHFMDIDILLILQVPSLSLFLLRAMETMKRKPHNTFKRSFKGHGMTNRDLEGRIQTEPLGIQEMLLSCVPLGCITRNSRLENVNSVINVSSSIISEDIWAAEKHRILLRSTEGVLFGKLAAYAAPGGSVGF